MKKQVRIGVFETNSSSEHSLALINLDKFRQWKEGKLMARVALTQEDKNCWGNFWSEMLSLEFTDDFEKAKNDNKERFNDVVGERFAKNEEYKNRCLSYTPKIQKELTTDELRQLTDEEYARYCDDQYMDSIHRFDKVYYDNEKSLLENMKPEDFDEHFGMVESGMWCTFQEFWDSWIKNNDCYSPFEHDDIINNVHIIGKYYHS
jgi:hypothetical protein